MHLFMTLPAVMATAIALGASGAALATEHDNKISTILGAKTSVVQAIAAAEQRTGGRAFEIDLEKEKNAYLYEIRTVSKDKLTEVTVDPESGKVVKTDDEGLIAKLFDWEDRGAFDSLAASSTSLAEAIVVAEQNVGGTAIEADLDDDEENVPTFKIEVFKDNTVHKVLIDSTTGTVLAIAPSKDDEDDD